MGKYHPFPPNFPFLWYYCTLLRALSAGPVYSRLGLSVKVKNCILENGIFFEFPSLMSHSLLWHIVSAFVSHVRSDSVSENDPASSRLADFLKKLKLRATPKCKRVIWGNAVSLLQILFLTYVGLTWMFFFITCNSQPAEFSEIMHFTKVTLFYWIK